MSTECYLQKVQIASWQNKTAVVAIAAQQKGRVLLLLLVRTSTTEIY